MLLAKSWIREIDLHCAEKSLLLGILLAIGGRVFGSESFLSALSRERLVWMGGRVFS